MWKRLVQPNQRLQLTLPPYGDRPLAALRGVLLDCGEYMHVPSIRLPPTLGWGAAETHNR
jgi:hypothetical protein